MECLEKQLDELKLVLTNPKLYLVKYFGEIRRQIDIECQIYLSYNLRDTEKAIQRQQELISQVDQFQEECLSHLETIACDLTDLEMFEQRLENLDFEETVATLQLERAIYCALYARKKLLFRNKGIIFLSKSSHNYYQKYLNKSLRCFTRPQDSSNGDVLVGSLFIIEDEFLLYNGNFQIIENVKEIENAQFDERQDDNEQTSDNQESIAQHRSYISSQEILRIHFGILTIVQELLKDNEPKAIYPIQLKLQEHKSAQFSWPHTDSSSPKEWTSELPTLKNLGLVHCHLKDLDPTTFQSLTNLNALVLSFNDIQRLDPEMFSTNRDLRVLKASNNQICELDTRLFQGLANLTEIYFCNNSITTISNGLFGGLANLQKLYLGDNRIKLTSENSNAFEGLSKLIHLDLSHNNISFLPASFFKDLSSLRKLKLNNNEIGFVDEKGLEQEPGVFKGLLNLFMLNLNFNSIKIIPEGIFEDLVSLRKLWLSNNQISVYPELVPSKCSIIK